MWYKTQFRITAETFSSPTLRAEIDHPIFGYTTQSFLNI